jgi:Ca2+-transporting ATPase
MLYYTKTIEDTLEELETSENGLSAATVDGRTKQYGLNVIILKGEPLWRKIIAPFTNVFMIVLGIAIIVSLIEHAVIDATIIGVIMASNAIIHYVQRFSTERILRSLQEYRKQSVEVIRGKKVVSIESSFLVPGDIVLLNEGEKIPADARILKATELRVDESQLTGESEPMTKQVEAIGEDKEVYERTNMLFQGSFIVSGEAMAVVTATGNTTEFGKLAGLAGHASSKSPVQAKIDKLLSQVIVAVLLLAALAFALSLYRGISVAESIRFIIALSVSAVPESLPVAISVILVLAMRRMARKKALVRGMSAIETIGAITTIATDKTGTLTQNVLTVQDTWQPDWSSAKIPNVLTLAINRRKEKTYDPLDAACSNYVADQKVSSPKGTPMRVFPFDTALAMSGNMWHHGEHYELALKGSPEAILHRSDLTEAEREEAEAKLSIMTSEGYRVIAIGYRKLPHALKKLADLSSKDKLEFAGFIAIADALRPEAKKAIKDALKAGVSVRMITGDHFETAFHIGRKLGMVTHRDQVFDSRRMHGMSDEELARIVEQTRIFSRVIPENKYRILTILKKQHITAMTGDGVNDVPALSNADVGIAMGSGSHIAKDAGDIILLDDNFKSIIDAMNEGRTVAANVRRMIYYLLATNAGEVLTAVSALIAGLPLPLSPVQILWVNLATDTCMVIPIGLEPGRKMNMRELPRSLKSPLLSKFIISRLIIVAIAMAVVALGTYVFFNNKYGHDYGRTIAFNALVVMQWASALAARSDYQSVFARLRVLHWPFYVGLTAAITLQLLALFGPLGTLLHVTPVAAGDLAITTLIAFSSLLAVAEMHKFVSRRFFGKGQHRLVVNATPDMVQ